MSHVWHDKDYRNMENFLDPQLMVESPVRQCVGANHLSDAFSIWFRAFPDMQYKEEDIHLYHNRVLIEWLVEGNHLGEFMGISATGRKVSYKGTTILSMSDNIIQLYKADVSLSPLIEQISPRCDQTIVYQEKEDMFSHFNRIVGVNLSRRQIECLALICLGNNNKAISSQLGIRYSTFRTHMERALPILGLSSTKEVFNWAFSVRILELLVHIGMNKIITI